MIKRYIQYTKEHKEKTKAQFEKKTNWGLLITGCLTELFKNSSMWISGD